MIHMVLSIKNDGEKLAVWIIQLEKSISNLKLLSRKKLHCFKFKFKSISLGKKTNNSLEQGKNIYKQTKDKDR